MGRVQPVFGNKLVLGGILFAITVAMVTPTWTPQSMASPPVPAAPTPSNSGSGTKYIAVEGPLRQADDAQIVDGLTTPDDAIVRPANFLSVEDENKPTDTPIAEIEPDTSETSSETGDSTDTTPTNIGSETTPAAPTTAEQPVVADVTVPTTTVASAPPITDPTFKDRSPLMYLAVGLPAQAADIPLDMSETKGKTLLPLFKENKNLGLHIELIRRAALTMEGNQQMELLVGLQEHQRAANTDPYRMFPLGLAKLLFADNQSGLYYLRKANDALQSPFTNLAYGLAQVGVDLHQEEADPASLNRRKQDAMFRLTDAVTAQGQRPEPGFWPAYLKTVAMLTPLEAYTEHITSDPTMLLLPYGDSVNLAYSPAQIEKTSTVMAAAEIASTPAPATSCTASVGKITEADKQSASRTLYVQADGKGTYETVRVWPKRAASTGTTDPTEAVAPKSYRMAITQKGNILADFDTTKAPYVFEDLDNDNMPELVLRQFETHPEEPVLVYRYNGCQYQPDTNISQLFH